MVIFKTTIENPTFFPEVMLEGSYSLIQNLNVMFVLYKEDMNSIS